MKSSGRRQKSEATGQSAEGDVGRRARSGGARARKLHLAATATPRHPAGAVVLFRLRTILGVLALSLPITGLATGVLVLVLAIVLTEHADQLAGEVAGLVLSGATELAIKLVSVVVTGRALASAFAVVTSFVFVMEAGFVVSEALPDARRIDAGSEPNSAPIRES